ncbi:cytochrome c [Pullulanibacillus sp. KACC 23026]|uniref:cytochrome c550 n=1 Tax=Pullulanibacillus sp. KACC 23026 TaxID=3028315 RepID=UPI0023AF31F5|nr:cytochrome c [Pullulanibacillus sp. KACC 23026]WEG14248.1 cytochrome c [Pullulanibacillus sp. KACC 23026]
MKRNPLIPFAFIAVIGIVLMLVIGVWGGNTARERANGGSSTSQSQAQTPDKIFQQNCSSCHGDQLQGGIGPNLQKIGSKLSKDQILTQIKNGGGAMPANVIQGKDAEAVATWLSKKK